jgi:hypothetical protein
MAAGGARAATIGLIPPPLTSPPQFRIPAFAARGLSVGAAINRLTPHSARGYEVGNSERLAGNFAPKGNSK